MSLSVAVEIKQLFEELPVDVVVSVDSIAHMRLSHHAFELEP